MHLNVPKPSSGRPFGGEPDPAYGLAGFPDVVVVLSDRAQSEHRAILALLLR
jgi:hypothetical protein